MFYSLLPIPYFLENYWFQPGDWKWLGFRTIPRLQTERGLATIFLQPPFSKTH